MPTDMIEQEVLSSAIAVTGRNFGPGSVEETIATAQDIISEAERTLLFSPWDRCFYVAVNGRERFRTDSPHLACAYFTAR